MQTVCLTLPPIFRPSTSHFLRAQSLFLFLSFSVFVLSPPPLPLYIYTGIPSLILTHAHTYKLHTRTLTLMRRTLFRMCSSFLTIGNIADSREFTYVNGHIYMQYTHM